MCAQCDITISDTCSLTYKFMDLSSVTTLDLIIVIMDPEIILVPLG